MRTRAAAAAISLYFSLSSSLFLFPACLWMTICLAHLWRFGAEEDVTGFRWPKQINNKQSGSGMFGPLGAKFNQGKVKEKQRILVFLTLAFLLPERKVSNLVLDVFFQVDKACKSWKTKAHQLWSPISNIRLRELNFFSLPRSFGVCRPRPSLPLISRSGVSEMPWRPRYCMIRAGLARDSWSDLVLLFSPAYFILHLNCCSSFFCATALGQTSPWMPVFLVVC